MNKFRVELLVIGIALWMPATWLLSSITGCAQGSSGVLRPFSDSANHNITNAVGGFAQAAPAILPAQYNLPVQAAAAAVLALLAAWQGVTHRKLDALSGKVQPPGGT